MKEKSDNKRKLAQFFANEYSNIKTYVNAKIRSTSERDAEDIIHDVAVNIFSKADFSAPINNVAAFVYSSLRNRIIDLFRGKKYNVHYQDADDEDYREIILKEFADKYFIGSDNAYSNKMKAQLIEAVNELKPKYKEIIIAAEFEGYTYQELSEMWKVPIGTLLSRRHRALAVLHNLLEPVKKSEYKY